MEGQKVIALCAGKGGEGCSASAGALAAALCKKGLRVLLVELDCRGYAQGLYFGVQDRVLFTLADHEKGRREQDVLLPVEKNEGLFLCFAPMEELSFSFLQTFLQKQLEEGGFDRVIVDASNLISAQALAKLASEILVVCTQNPSSLLHAQSLSQQLFAAGAEAKLLLCRFDLSDLHSYSTGRLRVQEMIDQTRLMLAGIVPEDYDLMRSCEDGRLGEYVLNKKEQVFGGIAARLQGEWSLLFSSLSNGKALRRSL
ncbi:MAG: P-loop NTPase [Clostridia bacterium]|nr:P-loop NTPase [Clostridia bacterium]